MPVEVAYACIWLSGAFLGFSAAIFARHKGWID